MCMSNQYYVFYLEDYFSPPFSTGNKPYLGTEEQLKELYLEFNAVKSITANIKKEKTLESTETTVFSFLNTWDCRYEIEISGYTAQVVIAQYKKTFIVGVWATLTMPMYRPEEPFEGLPDEFRPLDGRFWGYPLQIERQTQDNGSFYLSNKLAYIEKIFKSKEKAFAYFEQMTEPDFQGFFEDVFGDG